LAGRGAQSRRWHDYSEEASPWGGGEKEGVDEGEMEELQLLSLLHTVGFCFFSPFQVLSVLFTKPTDYNREREREGERERETGRHRGRGRGREGARACVRACGFWSTWYLCTP
jgi:hypothetical protein